MCASECTCMRMCMSVFVLVHTWNMLVLVCTHVWVCCCHSIWATREGEGTSAVHERVDSVTVDSIGLHL